VKGEMGEGKGDRKGREGEKKEGGAYTTNKKVVPNW